MTLLGLVKRQVFEAPCTVTIEHSADSLHAHVDIDSDLDIQPGDEVLVHDAPTDIAFGETLVVTRMATIIRATMRGLARERIRSGIGSETPFKLTRWSDGTLSLLDETSGRRIDLDAFGPTNAGAFAQFFSPQEPLK